MDKKLIFTIIFFVFLISISAVNATNNSTDDITTTNDFNKTKLTSNDYDKIVDHTKELDEYKNRPHASYTEVQDNSTYQKTFDDGVTIKIINKEGERKYYWIENGKTWTKNLELGLTNVNKDGLTVSHVILHGSIIKKEKEPVYKIVKKNKKIIKGYKKLMKNFGTIYINHKTLKSLKKAIKKDSSSCMVYDESKYGWKAFKLLNKKILPNYHGKYIKLKNKGIRYKYALFQKCYSDERDYKMVKFHKIQISVIVGLKPIYKTVKVKTKVVDHYNVIKVLHKY